ncbi:MAG: restriction endonuclease subunit S [Anaerolineales bacterium]|nr:restriction endonuclease subunit S [Anaerolineales bacterium]
MTPHAQLLTDHLDLWAAAVAPKSAAGRGRSHNLELYGLKKLRELILELAVRGLLVPQDPHDEPAAVLLKNIAAEKAKLVKEGKISKQKPLPPIREDEKPFDLPKGWEWVRLGYTGIGFTGKTPNTKIEEYFNGEIPFIGPGQITPSGSMLQPEKTLSEKGMEYSQEAKEGDMLMVCIGGSLGKSLVCKKRIAFNQQINSIRPLFINSHYLNYAVSTEHFLKSLVEKSTGSATPIINRTKWEELLLPLAPEQEQHRIVAKVDELMVLCDRLEQQQAQSLDTHVTLVRTLLAALTAGERGQCADAWARIADHFDLLFTTEDSIDELKQTIVQLAVMGKLVAQNPDDEPAAVLLKNIAAEKARLVKAGKLKKQTPLPPIREDEKPFDLPKGWEVARFGNIVFNRDAERIPLSVNERETRRGEFDYYGASGVIDSIDDYLFDKPLLLIGEDGANLINRSTPIAFIARGKYWVNNHAHVLDGLTEELLLYVCLHINAISLEPYITGTAQPKMNQAKMNSIVLSIPPEQEQHRIVAKVDELLALCDRLRARLAAARATPQQLADAVTAQALGIGSRSL